MTDWPRLCLIELPLAARTLLAGIKTAAVINVGTATIAAFIGAGGYGERIVAGLAVNDHALLLAGAVPAALMALAVQWAFDLLERRFFWSGRRDRQARHS
jgi:osmoprotectant transport system permease protein